MNILAQKDIDRFWGKVNKEISQTFYNGTRCWEWQGTCIAGYGYIKIGRKSYGAHRISYELNVGEIPDGLHILHHCDNHPCVNPDHLFYGTPKDNMDDKVKKGRQQRGEQVPTHKLSEEQVAEIRKQYGWRGKNGKPATKLSEIFHISRAQISRIINHKQRK